jgi:uncharacterized membrane protein YgcG
MSESDSLRMAAEITDRFSKPLKDLQRSLRSLAAETSSAHKTGTVSAKGHTESLLQLRREVTNVADRMKSGLAPALAGLGISGLSAAAGIAAVTKSIVDFAGNARHLEFMSKQTGLAVDQLRAWEQEASRLGTTAESLTGGFVEFNASMEKMARIGRAFGRESGIRVEMQELQGVLKLMRPGEISGLVRSLQGLSREAQIETILKFADKIPDISKRMEFVKGFHLDSALVNKWSAGILKDLDEIHKRLPDLTPQQLKGGTDLQESLENIKTSFTGLRDAIGADLAPTMAAVAESIGKFGQLHSGDIAAGLKEFVDRLRELGNSELVANLRAFAIATDKIVESTTGWFPILAAFTAFRVAKLFGIASGISAIATSVSALTALASPPAWLLGLLGIAGTVAADRDRQKRGDKGPGGLYGTPLYGFGPMGEPDLIPQGPEDRFRGNQGDRDETGAAPTKPLWRRLFDSINQEGGLLHKTSFQMPGDWAGALKSGGAGDPRGAEGIIERGTLAALRDFAAEQKGAEGGGGSGGMGALRANFSPGGGGGYGGAGAGTGEPGTAGGAGTGGGAGRAPMGSLGGGIGGGTGGAPGAQRLMRDLCCEGVVTRSRGDDGRKRQRGVELQHRIGRRPRYVIWTRPMARPTRPCAYGRREGRRERLEGLGHASRLSRQGISWPFR